MMIPGKADYWLLAAFGLVVIYCIYMVIRFIIRLNILTIRDGAEGEELFWDSILLSYLCRLGIGLLIFLVLGIIAGSLVT